MRQVIFLLRQPLTHFLLAGVLLFSTYELLNKDAALERPDLIVVDRDALLNFMQFQARAFAAETFSGRLDAMSQSQLDALIRDYVREEALYRESLALGMEKGDYIIRQRLVQKLEFLLQDVSSGMLEPSKQEIDAFYQQRREDYQVDSVYTFTHIFFDAAKHGDDEAAKLAETMSLAPDTQGIAFAEAPQYGDRYPFLQNYVERTRDYVSNNFSEDFVGALDALAVDPPQWHGPFASRYGYHLVLLTARSEPYIPDLDRIFERVVDDYRYEKLLEAKRAAEEKVISRYQVNVNL